MKPSPRVFQKHKEPGRETNGNSDIDVSHAIPYADIEIHVPNFKALTSWWLNTHSDYNSLRVTEAPQNLTLPQQLRRGHILRWSSKLPLVEMVVWMLFVKLCVFPANIMT